MSNKVFNARKRVIFAKKFPQYALSIWTLEERLCNFGIYYKDDEVSVENVKEVAKKELEGPGSCSLRIQPFLLAPRR